MKRYIRTLSPRLEFAIVVLGAFGIFIVRSVLTALGVRAAIPISNGHLRSLIVYEPVVAVVLLTFLRIRQWNLQSFGITPGVRQTLVGIGLAITAYLAYVVLFVVAAEISPFITQAAANQKLVAPGLSLPLVIAASIINGLRGTVCGWLHHYCA